MLSLSPQEKEIVLHYLKVGAAEILPPDLIDRLSLKQFINHIERSMVVKLSTNVFAEKLPPETVTQTKVVHHMAPATWWQHYKKDFCNRWWMRWLVKQRPVVFKAEMQQLTFEVNLERFWKYPEASIPRDAAEAFGTPVVFNTPVRHSLYSTEFYHARSKGDQED